MSSPTKDEAPPPKRDGVDPTTGRFLPGNKLGTGYPYVQRVQMLRQTMLRCVTPKQMQRCTTRLVDMALECEGTVAIQAMTLLFRYTLGPPEVVVSLRPAGEAASFRSVIEEAFKRKLLGQQGAADDAPLVIDAEASDSGSNGHGTNGSGK